MRFTNEGQPAFPIHEKTGDGTHYYTHLGMSLRDYFAAKALQGLMDAAMPADDIADEAYLMADAMLRAREAA